MNTNFYHSFRFYSKKIIQTCAFHNITMGWAWLKYHLVYTNKVCIHNHARAQAMRTVENPSIEFDLCLHRGRLLLIGGGVVRMCTRVGTDIIIFNKTPLDVFTVPTYKRGDKIMSYGVRVITYYHSVPHAVTIRLIIIILRCSLTSGGYYQVLSGVMVSNLSSNCSN